MADERRADDERIRQIQDACHDIQRQQTEIQRAQLEYQHEQAERYHEMDKRVLKVEQGLLSHERETLARIDVVDTKLDSLMNVFLRHDNLEVEERNADRQQREALLAHQRRVSLWLAGVLVTFVTGLIAMLLQGQGG